MTTRDWSKADEHIPDPARVQRDARETRGKRSLNELIQLAAIDAPAAKTVQERLDAGLKVYAFQRRQLDHWNRMMAEIRRRQGL